MTLFVGNSTVNSYIDSTNARIGANSTFTILTANATGVYSNSTLVANSTGPYGKTEATLNVNSALTANNSTNLGGTAAASYQLNSTLNANIASYLPTYTGVVNGSSHTVGTAFTANATVVNAVTYYVGSTLIANSTGPYGKTEGNLNVNSSLYANLLLRIDDRTPISNNFPAGTLRFGFTSLNANNTAPWADFLHMRSYTDSSGGSDNILMFNKSAIGVRVYQAAWTNLTTGNTSAYTTFKDLAFTDGTNSTGTWSINTSGTANNSSFLGGTAAASYQLNSTLNANIASYLPTYTGVVNGSSHTVGTAFTANSTVVNAVSYYAGSTLIGNTTGPYGKTEGTLNVNSALTANNSTNLGGTAAASYQLNSTLNANIAAYLPTYTGVVNGSSHTVGTAFTANATVVNAVTYYVGSTLIANSTGPYGKTEATLNVNSALTANNSTNLGGTAAAGYQTTAGLSANVATLTANNATNLGGQAAAYYTNATNISTGTLSAARGGTNSSLTPVSGGVVYSNATGMAITAAGTNTFVLASNGTAPVFTQIDMAYLPEATFKKSCRAATTADLSAASATAQVLTGGLVAFPAQDGITLVLNDRLLVKDQSNTAQNGIFYVSNTGSAAVYAWTLTRVNDANTSSRIASSIVAIDEGTVNGGRLFDNDFKTTDTLGTTAMPWNYNIDGGGGVFTGSVYPNSNTLLLGNSVARWVVSANTVDASGLITGAGGATITGTTNTSTAFQISTTFIANTTGVYHTGTMNAASHTVGTSTIANSTGVYTGVVNGSSHTVGTAFTANATVVNAVSYYAGTTLIGNTTGPYGKTEATLNVNSALTANNSTNLGGTAAASYQLNSTLNANIAAYLPVYTGVVNGSSHTVSTSFIANATGVYHTGTMNAASHTVGTAFTANATMTNTVSLVVSTNTATFGTAAYHVANGNFGIGNSAPADKLSVNGSAYLGGGYTYVGGFNTATYPTLGTIGTAFSWNFSAGQAEVNIWNPMNPTTYANTGFRFMQQLTASTYRDLMYIKQDGNVGIGTTAPLIKLQVAGNMGVDAFVECSQNVATSYTITTGKNAMSAGPISINSGVTITVPSGSTWTIV